jgi:hypothetical protein
MVCSTSQTEVRRMRWQDLKEAAAELAALAEERFAVTDLVLLGTLRKDGWPRITPIEYAFYDGDLMIGGMWQSKKMLDLLRDPRCTLHSVTTDKDGKQGDIKVYGRAIPLAAEREPGYWDHIYETIGFRPDGPAHVLTIDVQSIAYVVFDGTGMAMKLWPERGDA